MAQNHILKFCYMTQLSLQRNKTVFKDPVMFFVFFLLVCFYTNGKNAYRCKGGPHIFFLYCSPKTGSSQTCKFLYAFFFFKSCSLVFVSSSKQYSVSVNYNVQISFSVTCL